MTQQAAPLSLNSFGSDPNESGRLTTGMDFTRTDTGSLRLSGRDLLDILNAFTSEPPPPGVDAGAMAPLGGDGQQDKGNTQPLGAPASLVHGANMFQQNPAVRKLGGSSKKFADLGRCAPVGGAYAQFYAPGYDDYGYSSPSPMDPSASSQAFTSMAPATTMAPPNPMSFERILLAGKKIAGFGGPEGDAAAIARDPPTKKKATQQKLKKNQARTGYQHKPRKPHPVVEKARRDGINMLIEELRDIVPEGGWKASANEYKKTTSLRDALDAIHSGEGSAMAGSGVGKPDKRTKRSVLMDAIASIEALTEHVQNLTDQQAANPADAALGAADTPRSEDGTIFEEEAMKRVHVDIALRERSQVLKDVSNATPLQVKIAYFDRRGFLADECVAMRSVGMTIKSAELPKPNRNGFVQDTFDVEIEEDDPELEALQEQLVDALAETQSLYYRSQQAGDKRARVEA